MSTIPTPCAGGCGKTLDAMNESSDLEPSAANDVREDGETIHFCGACAPWHDPDALVVTFLGRRFVVYRVDGDLYRRLEGEQLPREEALDFENRLGELVVEYGIDNRPIGADLPSPTADPFDTDHDAAAIAAWAEEELGRAVERVGYDESAAARLAALPPGTISGVLTPGESFAERHAIPTDELPLITRPHDWPADS